MCTLALMETMDGFKRIRRRVELSRQLRRGVRTSAFRHATPPCARNAPNWEPLGRDGGPTQDV